VASPLDRPVAPVACDPGVEGDGVAAGSAGDAKGGAVVKVFSLGPGEAKG
jgi:hypothetical protein